MKTAPNNAIGSVHGRLTVVAVAGSDRLGRVKVQAKCICGNFKVVALGDLRSGNTSSCGCARLGIRNGFKHGMSRTTEYAIWNGINMRCHNPNSPDFHRYGGRGITVCKKWRSSFKAFFADMGPRLPSTTIERKNNNLGYSKDNCVWADSATQNSNRRDNVFYSAFGKRQTVSKWARDSCMNLGTLHGRLRRGWSIVKALTHPIQKHPNEKTHT